MKRFITVVLAAVIAAACLPRTGRAVALGTSFSYQGSIDRAGVPPTDSCTFVFKLYDDPLIGTQLGATITTPVTLLQFGQFSVQLDFGVGVFDGNARWLDIAVHCPGDNTLTSLAPRQAITATPYALYALSGAAGGGFVLPYSGPPVNSPAQPAFKIQNNATTGDGSGIVGIASTTLNTAAGVKGVNGSTTGVTVGTWGMANASPSGTGVAGTGGASGTGVYGSSGRYGVYGEGLEGVYGSGGTAGVHGDGTGTGSGVVGVSFNGYGVYATYGVGFIPGSGSLAGVFGNSSSTSANSAGVRGQGDVGMGVEGISTSGAGVFGHSTSSIGVSGASTSFFGVFGVSGSQAGVKGVSGSGAGLYGQSSGASGYGVFGTNSSGDGIWGQSSADARSGIVGVSSSATGIGGFFNNTAGGVALYANGLAQVKTLQILGADLAESFPIEGEGAEPGTVLAMTGDGKGTLRVCDEPYCRRVAGVVSGANGLAAGVVLQGREFDSAGKAAVAMSGRVWVKCDAGRSAIKVGDLLTTATRAGFAMRSADAARATGAILGKAMTSLETGTGLVLVLVSLQ